MTIGGLQRLYSFTEDSTCSEYECYPHGHMYQLIFQGRTEGATKGLGQH